jgi:putative FmdB family regulatory protein
MPKYDYRCSTCGHVEEREFSILEVPEVIEVCPDCGFGPLKKVILPAAVSFKGSGFYKTDSSRLTHVSTKGTVK